ncbi:MAG TPA: transglutaminase family protein [Kiritimatiellia bacterium]|nr:transglutaminase family protein [Kiritimatiellia bacterium]
MNYRVIHRTEYEYSDSANVCHNLAHLSPRQDAGQRCNSHFLSVVPQPSLLDERIDHFGNRTFYFSIEKPHRTMVVTATSLIDTQARNNTAHSASSWKTFGAELDGRPPRDQLIAKEFSLESPLIPRLEQLRHYAEPSFANHDGILAAAMDIMRRIFNEYTYDPAFTTLATPLRDVLEHKRGVCQDFAHLAIGCLRSFGIPARYISGYLETQPPPGQAKLVGADASHAWLSVYTPDAGWIELDPTNNQRPDNRYIVIGWGRDYSDLPPLKGVIFGGGTHNMKVSVDVEPLNR